MLSSGRTYSSVWHLVDKDGNYHNVVYNQDLNQPAIVVRWITLRDFYQLTDNHLVSLHHYGKSAFFLTIFKTPCLSRSFSRWHSLYHQVLGSVTFKVYLTEQKVSCSSLINNFLILFLYFSSFKFHNINCWHNISLFVRTFQVSYIIFWKTKVGLICTWKMLQNVGSCSIIGGRH